MRKWISLVGDSRRKHKFVGAVLVLCIVLSLSAPAMAALTSKTIEVLQGVTIYMDGEVMVPKDANGKTVETFVYNGTTYVPIRAVSEYLGKYVEWDGETKSVYIGEVPGEQQYLLDVCPPYQTSHYIAPDTIKMAGQKYTKGFYFEYSTGYALFNLNGRYDSLEFDVGHVDGSYMDERTLNIYLDDELAFSLDMTGEMMPQHYVVPLNGALQMKIAITDNWYECYYGIVNITVE